MTNFLEAEVAFYVGSDLQAKSFNKVFNPNNYNDATWHLGIPE